MKIQIPFTGCRKVRHSAFLKGWLGVLTVSLTASVLGQTADTWTGGGAPYFAWSTNANWSAGAPVMDNVLSFGGSTGVMNTNNLSANTEFGGITFNSGAGQFTLDGNQITLMNGGGITNNSAVVQTNNLSLGINVTNNNYVNYVTTPGGGEVVITAQLQWANNAVTNDSLIFQGATVQANNASAATPFGIGGNTASVSNTVALHNSFLDGVGLRRLNMSSGTGNVMLFDNTIATNIDGMIIGNSTTSFNNTLVVSNGSKIYITGGDIYEIGRNTGSQGHQLIVTGTGSAIYSGTHAFAVGGSSGSTTNCTVEVLNGGLWNLGGGAMRLNFNGPQMNLLCTNGVVTNVYSMIIGNGNSSNNVVFAGGSKFYFSAASGDFREVGRGNNAISNSLTITDPNSVWNNGGATITVGGTASSSTDIGNVMTIANNAIFTNGSIQEGGQGAGQLLIISNATAYITQLQAYGDGGSETLLEGGNQDNIHIDGITGVATGLITNTASTAENIVLGWQNGGLSPANPPVIGGLINFNKVGTGTQSFATPNTFIGNITVSGGTLTSGAQQAAVDGSTSAFGCLTNAGKTITITNGGTVLLGGSEALLNGQPLGATPAITIYPGSTLSSSGFNQLGQVTLDGGTLTQNSTQGSPLNGYAFYTNVVVGGSAGSSISVGANGEPDDLYNASSGGTTFNVANTFSGGADLTVSAGLADSSNSVPGSLVITGNGDTLLSGTNTYTGSTTVVGGKLGLYTYSLQSGPVTVDDGAAFDVNISGGSQVTNSTLTLGSSSGATIEFLALNSTAVSPVVAGNLNLNGITTINLINPTFVAGNTYPLINYTTPSGSGGLKLGSIPRGASISLVTNNSGGTFTIALNVATVGQATTDIWSGLHSGNWDINLTTNWVINGSPNTYFNGDNVQFTDSSSVTNVTLSTAVTPGSTTVNSGQNYTFITSAGSFIGGTTGSNNLTKLGSGSLTLSGLNNTYVGTNFISGGTVVINADGNLGASSDPIFLNGATLTAAGTFALNNGRTFDLGPASGSGTGTISVNTNQTLAFAGVIQNNGSDTGSLTKTGPGTFSLSGPNTYSGSTLVSGGSLILSSAQQGGGALTVSDGAALTIQVSGTTVLPAATFTLGVSGNTTLTLQNVSGTTPAINANNLVANGTVNLSVLGGAVKVGEVPLIKYSAFTGSLANFALANTLPPNVTAVLTNDVTGKFIGLVITSINGLTWSGINGVNWDITTTTNWLFGAVNTVYSDGSPVLFNDSGGKNVTIEQVVSPNGVTVNNSSVLYTFSSAAPADGIAGSGGFTKIGSSTLTYSSVTNSYSGVTVIAGGAVDLGAHPADTVGQGSELLEFSTNSVFVTNGASLLLAGIGGSATVYPQYINNNITLDGGAQLFCTDGGQNFNGQITIGNNGGASMGDQQVNKYLYLNGPVTGSGPIYVPSFITSTPYTPGGSGYGGPFFINPTNSYDGTIVISNGYIAIDDPNGTALTYATVNILGFNNDTTASTPAPGAPIFWTSNETHTVSLAGIEGTAPFNLSEPQDGWYVALTLSNNAATPLVYGGALSDTSGSATVTKDGSTAQWLTGSNTYSAPTTINGGLLGISTLHAGDGSFTVADGASFGVTNIVLTVTNATSTNLVTTSAAISSLTLGNSGATTFEFENLTNAGTLTPLINCSGALTVNGSSAVTIVGSSGLVAGTVYPLATVGSFSGNGHFTLSLPPGITANLVTNGGNTLALNVVSIAPPLPTTPTNIVYSVSGNQLTLSWPASYTGWILQVQTNGLAVGLSTNWVSIPSSTNADQLAVPMNQQDGSVFYRLVYP